MHPIRCLSNDIADLCLQIADSKLTIRGKLPERAVAEAEEVIGERHAFTSFDRTFRLWDGIETSEITAKLVRYAVVFVPLPVVAGHSA